MKKKNCCIIFKNEITVARVVSSFLENHLNLKIIIINNDKIILRSYFNTLGLDVQYAKKFNEKKILKYLKKEKIHYIIFNLKTLLTKRFLYSYKGLIFSVHGGDLPKYRGMNTIRWMVANGIKKLTSTLFLISPKIDSGKIIAKRRFNIKFPTSLKQIEKQSYYETRLPLYNLLPNLIKTQRYKKYIKRSKKVERYYYNMHGKFVSLLDKLIKTKIN